MRGSRLKVLLCLDSLGLCGFPCSVGPSRHQYQAQHAYMLRPFSSPPSFDIDFVGQHTSEEAICDSQPSISRAFYEQYQRWTTA
jgi:hypothetical protein